MDIKKLIDSLSISEKRYFRIFAQMHVIGKRNNYLDLFEKLATAKSDTDLKKAISKTSYAKHLLVVASYLQKLILKSLRSYHDDGSITMSLQNSVQNIELLYNKGLYLKCLSLIKKVKRRALLYELLHTYLQVIIYEKHIYALKNVKIAVIETLFVEESRIYQILLSNQKLQLDLSRMRNLAAYKGPSQDKKDINKLDLVIIPLQKIRPLKDSFLNQLYYYEIFAIYEIIRGNFKKTYSYRKKIIELYNTNPAMIKLNPWFYFQMFILFLNLLEQQKKFNEAYTYLNQMASQIAIYLRKKKEINSIELQVLSHRLNIKILTRNLDDFELIISKMNEKLKGNNNESLTEVTLVHQMRIIIAYLLNKNYSESLDVTSNLLNKNISQIRMDLQIHLRLLNLILHYELNNFIYLESLIVNTLYFLKKFKKKYGLEFLVINFIKEAILLKNKNSNKALLKILKKKVRPMLDKNSYSLFYLFLLQWIDNKLDN